MARNLVGRREMGLVKIMKAEREGRYEHNGHT
jgi:hypothetical protein